MWIRRIAHARRPPPAIWNSTPPRKRTSRSRRRHEPVCTQHVRAERVSARGSSSGGGAVELAGPNDAVCARPAHTAHTGHTRQTAHTRLIQSRRTHGAHTVHTRHAWHTQHKRFARCARCDVGVLKYALKNKRTAHTTRSLKQSTCAPEVSGETQGRESRQAGNKAGAHHADALIGALNRSSSRAAGVPTGPPRHNSTDSERTGTGVHAYCKLRGEVAIIGSGRYQYMYVCVSIIRGFVY